MIKKRSGGLDEILFSFDDLDLSSEIK